MEVPEQYLNPELYKKAKKKADATYKRHSAYKSMFLSKTYIELGGKYKGKKKGSLSKWREEEWIQVLPFLKNGKKIICGSGDNKKGCRPFKRINDKTPETLPELIKKHGKKKMLELAEAKVKDMNRRISWKLGKIY